MKQLTFEGLEILITEDEAKKDTGTVFSADEAADRISGTKAMDMLDLSRHTFEKLVKEGTLTQHIDGKKKYYSIREIKEIMQTDA